MTVLHFTHAKWAYNEAASVLFVELPSFLPNAYYLHFFFIKLVSAQLMCPFPVLPGFPGPQ